jgi:hypothetical protein
MNRLLVAILAFLMIATSATDVRALGWNFTKEDYAAVGKHCVHGFWVNEMSVAFVTGDMAQLNVDLAKLGVEGHYATRKVIIHVGTKKAKSPWDKNDGDTFADWSVTRSDVQADAAKAVPRVQLDIDIWLSSKIRLENLRIPVGFEVISGGEIERFIQNRKGSK